MKWGLLSTANINRRLIPAIREADRAELLAVASRSQAQAEAYADQWGIPRAHGGYEALLDDPEIDVVYISLPNSLHAEWTVRAARAGKHVLCEKPLALSVAECEQIRGAARDAGVVVAEAVMYLHHPLLHEARRLVEQGAVGQVRLLRGAFSFQLDRPGDVRWSPDLGGGSLWDVGSYPVSFMRWIAGEPEEVFGWQQEVDSGVDGSFAGLLRFTGDVVGSFHCSFQQPFGVEAEVFGTEGALIVESPYLIGDDSRIRLLRAGREEQEITVPWIDAYRSEVEAVTAAVLDGANLPVSLARSQSNVATLVALYASARSGSPVTP